MVLTTARDVRCWPCYWLETKELYKEEEFHVYDFLLVGDSRLCCWRFHSPSRPRQTKRQLSQRCTRDDFVTVEIAVSKVQIWKSRIKSSNHQGAMSLNGLQPLLGLGYDIDEVRKRTVTIAIGFASDKTRESRPKMIMTTTHNSETCG